MEESDQPKVIHIPRRFTEKAWGGTESMLIHLCRELTQQGYRSEIWTSRALDSDPRSMISGTIVRRFNYFYPYFGLSRESKARLDLKGGNIFSFSLLLRLLFSRKPNLIHLHTAKRLGSIGRWVGRLRKIPYIVSVHGGVLETTESELKDFTEPTRGALEWGKILGAIFGSRKVYDDAAAIHCVNASEAKRFQELYPQKWVSYIPNGVNSESLSSGNRDRFREHHKIPRDALLMGCISRIDRQKNQLLLIRAFDGLANEHPHLNLLIAGPVTSVEYAEEIRSVVGQSKFRSRIFLLGALNPLTGETADGFKSLDIFVLPSDHEPFGIAILEAWAAGCAVVASAVGGIPSFTRDGQDVLLFRAGSREDLCDQVGRLVRDSELRQSLSVAGGVVVRQEFDWSSIGRRFGDLYRRVQSTYI